MTTSASLLTALIAAATAVVVGAATQVVLWRRERGAREYDRRRSALLDAQEAALGLRNRLGEYGAAVRSTSGARPDAALSAAQRLVDDGMALVAVRVTRVDDAQVVRAIREWRDRARYHYVSAEDVTTAEELAAWDAMNARIGAALRSDSGRSG